MTPKVSFWHERSHTPARVCLSTRDMGDTSQGHDPTVDGGPEIGTKGANVETGVLICANEASLGENRASMASRDISS